MQIISLGNGIADHHGKKAFKWRNITLLIVAEILIMGLRFSASSVLPQMTAEWSLTGAQQSWMTMSVQLGFVFGALLSAVLNLSDRIPLSRLIAASALAGALFNAAIPLLHESPALAFLLRFFTGIALAGAYPPGMKFIATWCKEDRGLGIGLLVGGTVLGTAVPHLLNAFSFSGEGGMPPWRAVLLTTSGLAAAAALLVGLLARTGPHLEQGAPFDWRFASRLLSNQPMRLANFGYLGHMWELFGMWTWVPLFLMISYENAGYSPQAARLAGFGAVAMGSMGSMLAGKLADRFGRTTITTYSLIISASCALTAGLFLKNPMVLTFLCLLWGFAVVADSGQFSAAVSELADKRYVGTALTVQTSLGFLLTLIPIRLIPALTEIVGWEHVFLFLAVGPAFGIWSMQRLRRLPESLLMASGNR
jgi:MFS family permease